MVLFKPGLQRKETYAFNKGLNEYILNCLWLSLGSGSFPGGWVVKNLPAMQETQVWSLSWEDPLQEGMAIHSSILAWRIPWTEVPGGLQSVGSQRVRHDWSNWAPCTLGSRVRSGSYILLYAFFVFLNFLQWTCRRLVCPEICTS